MKKNIKITKETEHNQNYKSGSENEKHHNGTNSLFFIIKEDDSPVLRELLIEAFHKAIEREKNTIHIMIDEQADNGNGKIYMYNKKYITEQPLHDKSSVDLPAFREALRNYAAEVSKFFPKPKFKKRYYAYPYKLLKDKCLGKGFDSITQKDFISLFKDLNIDMGTDKTISKYAPRGLWDDGWKKGLTTKPNHLDEKADKITKIFIRLYNEAKHVHQDERHEKVD